jgi:hypothetical protein
VFAALKAREPEAAEAAMRLHLTRQRVALRELAEQRESLTSRLAGVAQSGISQSGVVQPAVVPSDIFHPSKAAA